MLRYVLDTNIVIYSMRQRGKALRSRLRQHPGQLAVSTITAAELYFGAERSNERDRNLQAVDEVLELVDLMEFDRSAAAHAAQIKADLQRRGLTIGPYDVLIAGHARSLGLVLVTNNRAEFDRVEGLRVEDWSGP